MTLDVRAAAAGVIGDVLGGNSLNQALPRRLSLVSERDQSLLQQLCYGTLRHAPRLQALLGLLLEKPLRDKDRDLQGLLLCGLYQLSNTRVPDHAAVAATVEATRALKKHWAKGMVNAILRRYLREQESLAESLQAAAAASHPQWLYQTITAQWQAAAAAVIDANNQQPPMCLRVNRLRRSRVEYLAALHDKGIAASPGDLASHSIQLENPVAVWELPGFAAGEVSVQDEAAQLAAILLQARVGERVLDACAAPGGKGCHILELEPDLAELVVMDIDAARLEKVAENLQRLALRATQVVGDAATPPADLGLASFDRILVDAPCSATGVIRRHPDVKLLRRPSDIAAMAEQQQRILNGVWPLLKAGGTLLYATCSILDEENNQVVERFLASQVDASILPYPVSWGLSAGCGRQLLPASGGPDGLFYALLQKAR